MKMYPSLFVAVASVALSQMAISQTEEPVMIDPSVGCTANAKVTNVESSLSVRGGPSQLHDAIDQLSNGDVLYVCDTRHEGWFGVVYPNFVDECDVSPTASGSVKAYEEEECGTGWVSSQYISR